METAATRSATSSTSNAPTEKPRLPAVLGWLADGVVGAWIALGLGLGLALAAGAPRLAGIWEVQHGALGFLPVWMLLAVAPGLCGGILAAATHGQASRWVAPVLGGAFGGATAWGVGGGRHLAQAAWRGGFALMVAGLAALGLWLLVRGLRRLAPGPGSATGALVLGACVAELVNQQVLVRLYPAFHAALSFCALLLLAWAWCLRPGRRAPSVFTGAWLLALLVLSAAAAVPMSRRVASFDNFRWMMSETSPTLAWGLDVAALIAPPPEQDAQAALKPLGSRKAHGLVDFRGRSILLITVDALRADHLGAYGYERPTTPFVDELAEKGVRFDAAYAPTPHTSYSITSLMTGKYMRPLLLQGAGADSDLWAEVLRTYEYRTAGFYPPAVFFIDGERFEDFRQKKLGFEYAKVEFAEGERRLRQVDQYLRGEPDDQKLFVWVHLFGPHEPYEKHRGHDFGDRDIDRYDSEIRAADETIGAIVERFRTRAPEGIVIVSSDHGEEFGEHGGRYHGTTVYEEQVRVPLIISAPGLPRGRVVDEPVQTIDLMPTVLSALHIPIPPRIRGRDLTPLLADDGSDAAVAEALAAAETSEFTMLARGPYRLVCQRRSGACQLFHLPTDPGQQSDVSRAQPQTFEKLKREAFELAASHGRYEARGLRAEGKGWPAAIVRGLSGDAEVAPELARLLEDADAGIRQKAAELLFELGNTGQAPALRLAMRREERPEVRAWIALTLTRLGQGAPLVHELLTGDDQDMSRMAALALAEQGRGDGEDVLIRWWAGEPPPRHEQALAILEALAKIRSTEAVTPLLLRLDEVRLRPHIAEALAAIGDRDALPHLALALGKERYHSIREPLARAVADLGGDDELIVPLRRFLGVPDALENGLELALRAGVLDEVGGLESRSLARLEQLSDSGVQVRLIVPPVPKREGEAPAGVRLLLLVRNHLDRPAQLLVDSGSARNYSKDDELSVRYLPEIRSRNALKIEVPAGEEWSQVSAVLPERFAARPGHHLSLAVFSERGLEIKALAAVPLRAELPPPPPEPWENSSDETPAADADSDKERE